MRRFSISYKLITAAVILVAGLTITFALIGTSLLHNAYDQRARKLQRERIADLKERSESMAKQISATSIEALAGTEANRLTSVLRQFTRTNNRIIYAIIADSQARVIAHSETELPDTLEAGTVLSDVNPNELVDAKVNTKEGFALREITNPIRPDMSKPPLGYLRIGWTLKQLDDELQTIEDERKEDIEKAATDMIFAGLGAIAVGIIAGIFGGIRLGRPVRTLAETARAISNGDMNVRAQVNTGDEIGELAETMNSMVERIGELLEETRAKAELEQELSVARHIQQALLPGRQLVRRPGFDLCGMVESASHCGGDWWAFCELTRSRTLVLVGDVTGHGISSAMLTATARSCLDTVRTLTNNDFRVGHFLRILDQLLREFIGDEFHMTCFAAIIDPLENTLTYANAGHNPPFLVRKRDDGWKHGWLAARGNRLGDADGFAFVEHTITTSDDDLICWYTDGLVEMRRQDDVEFGTRRLRRALARCPDGNPTSVLDQVISDFNEFRKDSSLHDDVTCVIGRIV